MTTIRSQVEAHVKVIQCGTVFCQKSGCEQLATYLFRSGTIVAYCESHARAEAVRIGIELPIAGTKMPPSGTFSGRFMVGRSGAAYRSS
jgi:hypothetical protein